MADLQNPSLATHQRIHGDQGMRRAARVDKNQQAIIEAFRYRGASVAITSNQHSGFPDLCIGYMGVTVLVEVKNGDKPPSARALTPDQIEFHKNWHGACCVVDSEKDVVALLSKLMDWARALQRGLPLWSIKAKSNV